MDGNCNGNGNTVTGMGMTYFSIRKKIPITGHAKCVAAQTSSYTCASLIQSYSFIF